MALKIHESLYVEATYMTKILALDLTLEILFLWGHTFVFELIVRIAIVYVYIIIIVIFVQCSCSIKSINWIL